MALKSGNIDFTVFVDVKYCQTNELDITKCASVNRVLTALKYYQQLLNDKNKHNIVPFIQNQWPNYLNDNIHFIKVHGDDLHQLYQLYINQYGKPCEIRACTCMQRNYIRTKDLTVSDTMDNDQHDSHTRLYQSRLDATHNYLLHSFDLAIRYNYDTQETGDGKQNDSFVSAAILTQRNKMSDLFERIESSEKFMLNTGFVNSANDRTLLDYLSECILDDEIRHYLLDEQYDTDAVIDDIVWDSSLQTSNILKRISNKTLMKRLNELVQCYRLSKRSFSSGFVFWYWPHYASNSDKHQDLLTMENVDDFGGYTQQELYIERGKYDTFKTEILSYTKGDEVHINMDEYNEIFSKANVYEKTDYCKGNIYAKNPEGFGMRHYGIKETSPVTRQHLMSILLYCNYTQLCTSFSATFRKLHYFETLSEVKQGNQQYFFLSKYLRELVEFFGRSWFFWDNINRQYMEDEQGPFYTGMNVVMIMPSFSIRLYGPTSTTRQFSTACVFAGTRGIIIQLNNQHYSGGREQRFFYTGWISDFAAEDERFTFGGSYAVQIQDIRIIETHQRHQMFLEPLFRLDAILSGSHLGFDWNKNFVLVLNKLIDYANTPKTKNLFGEYIEDTLNNYLRNKRTLVFNLPKIDESNLPQDVLSNMFHNVIGVEDKKKTVYVDKKDETNLPHAKILRIFKNVEKIVIFAVDQRGRTTYQMSLPLLLEKVKGIKCVLVGTWKDWKGKKDKRKSWLSYIKIPDHATSSLTTQVDYNGACSDVLTIQSKTTSNKI